MSTTPINACTIDSVKVFTSELEYREENNIPNRRMKHLQELLDMRIRVDQDETITLKQSRFKKQLGLGIKEIY